MLATIFTWFSTSIGKTVARWASLAAVAAAVYWKIYADGQAAARAKQVANDLNARKDREKIDDHVRTLDSAAVDRELARWVRHDG